MYIDVIIGKVTRDTTPDNTNTSTRIGLRMKRATEYYQSTPKRRRLNEGKCLKRICQHPTARKMVQCESCLEWLHCLCAGVNYLDIKDKEYKCKQCVSK